MEQLNRSILVVDDEVQVREILEKLFMAAGFEVETAQSGPDAINRIRNRQYDVILTDMKMPGMSGQELFDYIRKTLKSSVPVLGMSGTAHLMDGCDFDGILEKPFTLKDSISIIGQVVNPG